MDQTDSIQCKLTWPLEHKITLRPDLCVFQRRSCDVAPWSSGTHMEEWAHAETMWQTGGACSSPPSCCYNASTGQMSEWRRWLLLV